MSKLFSELTLRDLTFKNRVFVSPMCQYSSREGLPTDWHFVHLGSRAVGGAALVMVEATAVSPEGRISPDDSGIWSGAHADAFKRITDFVRSVGSVPAVQLAHAGRKASTAAPWFGGKGIADADGGWTPIAPSPGAFADDYREPRAMTAHDIRVVLELFEAATRRALDARFDVVEIHMAHGYLLHEFLSPLTNTRDDEYGGDFEGRTRFPLEVARAVRAAWPSSMPVFVRVSATDWVEGGWDADQTVRFASELKKVGIDLVDCSTGGAVAKAKIPVGPNYQVPFAARVRREAGIASGAVGLITEPHQAETIIAEGEADVVLLARQMLRDPYWPLHAARELGADVTWPVQYDRAAKR